MIEIAIALIAVALAAIAVSAFTTLVLCFLIGAVAMFVVNLIDWLFFSRKRPRI